VYKISTAKHEGKRHLGDLAIHRTFNIKMNITEIWCEGVE